MLIAIMSGRAIFAYLWTSFYGVIQYIIPGDQEGLFKLAIQLRKFLFITL
jgi:hypothetical protein